MQISNLINIKSFSFLKDTLIKSLTPQQKLICQIASIALASLAATYALVVCYRKLKATITREADQPTGIIQQRQPLPSPQPSVENDQILAILAQTLYKEGRLDEAAQKFQECLALNPNNHSAVIEYACLLYFQNNDDEAIAILNNYLENNPTNLKCLILLADILYQQDQFDEAIVIWERALSINPNNAHILSACGETLRMLDQFDKAEEMFKKSLEISPDNAYALGSYGALLRSQGKLDESIYFLNKCLEINPENIFALDRLGRALYDQKKFTESIEALNKCLQLDSEDNPFTQAYLGYAHLKQGNISDAKHAFSEALQLESDNSFILTGYGIALRMEGDLAQSLTVLEKSVASFTIDATPEKAMDPKEFKRLLEAIGAYAETLRCLDRPEEALLQFEKALVMDSQNIDFLLGAARCLCMLGKLELARTQFEHLLAIDPTHQEALDGYHLCEDPNWGQTP